MKDFLSFILRGALGEIVGTDFIIVLCTIVMGFLVALIDVVQSHLARVSGIEVTK